MDIKHPEQADIEVIAYFCGATVKYRELSSCAARIVGRGNKAIITVDQTTSPQRQRFSIAHELGHWLQDRGEVAFNCRSPDISPVRCRDFKTDKEAAANRFAVELLMPEQVFKPAAANLPITFNTARQLASMFKVSLTSAAIRLIELGSFPSIIVCNHIQGYRWSWRHPELPRNIRVRRLLSKDTCAYLLLRNTDYVSSGPTEVDADDWFDNISEELTVMEDSIRLNGKTTLTLVWCHFDVL